MENGNGKNGYIDDGVDIGHPIRCFYSLDELYRPRTPDSLEDSYVLVFGAGGSYVGARSNDLFLENLEHDELALAWGCDERDEALAQGLVSRSVPQTFSINDVSISVKIVAVTGRDSLTKALIYFHFPSEELCDYFFVLEEWFSLEEYDVAGDGSVVMSGFSFAGDEGLMLNSIAYNALCSYLGRWCVCIGASEVRGFVSKIKGVLEEDVNKQLSKKVGDAGDG